MCEREQTGGVCGGRDEGKMGFVSVWDGLCARVTRSMHMYAGPLPLQ